MEKAGIQVVGHLRGGADRHELPVAGHRHEAEGHRGRDHRRGDQRHLEPGPGLRRRRLPAEGALLRRPDLQPEVPQAGRPGGRRRHRRHDLRTSPRRRHVPAMQIFSQLVPAHRAGRRRRLLRRRWAGWPARSSRGPSATPAPIRPRPRSSPSCRSSRTTSRSYVAADQHRREEARRLLPWSLEVKGGKWTKIHPDGPGFAVRTEAPPRPGPTATASSLAGVVAGTALALLVLVRAYGEAGSASSFLQFTLVGHQRRLRVRGRGQRARPHLHDHGRLQLRPRRRRHGGRVRLLPAPRRLGRADAHRARAHPPRVRAPHGARPRAHHAQLPRCPAGHRAHRHDRAHDPAHRRHPGLLPGPRRAADQPLPLRRPVRHDLRRPPQLGRGRVLRGGDRRGGRAALPPEGDPHRRGHAGRRRQPRPRRRSPAPRRSPSPARAGCSARCWPSLAGVLYAPPATSSTPSTSRSSCSPRTAPRCSGGCAAWPSRSSGAIVLGLRPGLRADLVPAAPRCGTTSRSACPGIFLFLVLLALPEAKLTVGRLVGRDMPAVPRASPPPSCAASSSCPLVFARRQRGRRLPRRPQPGAHLRHAPALPGPAHRVLRADLAGPVRVLRPRRVRHGQGRRAATASSAWARRPRSRCRSAWSPPCRRSGSRASTSRWSPSRSRRCRATSSSRTPASTGRAASRSAASSSSGSTSPATGPSRCSAASCSRWSPSACSRCDAAPSAGASRPSATARRPAPRSASTCAAPSWPCSRSRRPSPAWPGALYGGLGFTASQLDFEPLYNVLLFLFAFVGGITTVTGALARRASCSPRSRSCSRSTRSTPGLVFAVIAVGAVALGKQPNGLAGLLYSWTDRSAVVDVGGAHRGRDTRATELERSGAGRCADVARAVRRDPSGVARGARAAAALLGVGAGGLHARAQAQDAAQTGDAAVRQLRPRGPRPRRPGPLRDRGPAARRGARARPHDPRDAGPVRLGPVRLRPRLARLSGRPHRQPGLADRPGRRRRQQHPRLPGQGGGLLPGRARSRRQSQAVGRPVGAHHASSAWTRWAPSRASTPTRRSASPASPRRRAASIEDGKAVSRTRVVLGGVNLLGGVISIDSLVTDLVAVHDGTTGAADGGTTATGVKFLGLAAVAHRGRPRARRGAAGRRAPAPRSAACSTRSLGPLQQLTGPGAGPARAGARSRRSRASTTCWPQPGSTSRSSSGEDVVTDSGASAFRSSRAWRSPSATRARSRTGSSTSSRASRPTCGRTRPAPEPGHVPRREPHHRAHPRARAR